MTTPDYTNATRPPKTELTTAEKRQARADAAVALAEDIGTGDLSAPLAGDKPLAARLLCKAETILCGVAWFEACFNHLTDAAVFDWQAADGDNLRGGETVCVLQAPAAALLAAERSALNFLQTLSATAAAANKWQKLAGDVAVVDTRKTLPLLRLAQKYAVRVGGARNHRLGLFDEILIKENHIAAAGGIGAALTAAFAAVPKKHVQIEVRNREELRAAVANGAGRVLLDNFPVEEIRRAVAETPAGVELEASGGVDEKSVAAIAAAGVHRISIGAMTKNIRAADFSLLAHLTQNDDEK